MGKGPRVLASGSNQVPASISVIKKGTALHPSHEPVLTSTKAPSSPQFPQKVGRAKFISHIHNLTTQNSASIKSIDVLSAVNDGDSLLRQQLALLITSVDSCC